VHTTRKVSNPKQLLDGLRGGGGTDFRPVFDELSKVRPRPDVLIFITDGGGWAPELPPPGIKVIWLLVGSHKMKPLRPTGGTYESITWGDMIEVDE
jgi:predicted metal-dependent peptidase